MPEELPTEWVIVRHTRVGPISTDEVVGHYATEADAIGALNQLIGNRPWFTEYSLERRTRLGEAGVILKATATGDKPA